MISYDKDTVLKQFDKSARIKVHHNGYQLSIMNTAPSSNLNLEVNLINLTHY